MTLAGTRAITLSIAARYPFADPPCFDVDERDHLVEEVVAHVQDVGLLEVDDAVAVGVGGRRVPDLDRLAARRGSAAPSRTS